MEAHRTANKLYLFGCNATNQRNATAEAVGNKALHLIHMAAAGLPVPPGFVLPTALCQAFFREGEKLSAATASLIDEGVRTMETATGLHFGADRRPLLVSVRSGAAVSMPGMMDTILNIGLCDRTLPALIRMTGNPRHAWDCYRRLIQTYAEVVHGLPAEPFDQLLEEQMRQEGVPAIAELDAAALKTLSRAFLDHYQAEMRQPFPQDPMMQLTGAVAAVFRSWQSPRAKQYRRLHGLDDLAGTAVTIQTMVFGNMGGTSGSGVGFTRDPATGKNELYVDFLANAQGEDVVSGRCVVQTAGDLQQSKPDLYHQLKQVGKQLEQLFHDAEDFEFTVQDNKLFLLQSRSAKRTGWAAVHIACDLVAEGLIDEATALERLAGYDLDGIQNVRLANVGACRVAGAGTPASPGVAVGEAVFDPDRAMQMVEAGRTPVLIRADISTADIGGLAASAGVLSARGGRTSHAAVVARHLNKVCIVGCRELVIDASDKSCRMGERRIDEGAMVSLDGHSGKVYAGKVEVVVERPTQCLEQIGRWKNGRQKTGAGRHRKGGTAAPKRRQEV